MTGLVLDSEALSSLVRRRRGAEIDRARAVLRVAHERGLRVVVPAAVLLEVYRGTRADGAVDSALTRTGAYVMTTGRAVARVAGGLLARDRLDSCHAVDAAVVATAVRLGGAVISTGDPGDLRRLARDHRNVQVMALR
jgi:predicted nucleic acid-binding protein